MAAIQNPLHVSEYSPDGKLLALISSDGKLKIWDIETNELKQEFVPKLHLSVPFTCFTWITVDNAAGGAKDTPKKKTRKTTPYIALGSKKGGVSLYSFASAKVESELKGGGHQGQITAICRGPTGVIFTSGEDCRVIVWDLTTGSQTASWNVGSRAPSSIAYLSATNRLAVAEKEIRVWSVEEETELEKFSGHVSNITLLRYIQANDREYILSAAKSDSMINLWQLKQGKERKRTPTAYNVKGITQFVSFRVDNNEDIRIAAVTHTGQLFVFQSGNFTKEGKEISYVKPKVTFQIATDSSNLVEPLPIVIASVEHSNNKNNIRFGYGDRNYLRFEEIPLDYSTKEHTLFRSDPRKAQTKANAKANSLKTITPHIDASNVEYQTPVVHRGKVIDIPMETRLHNLSLGTAAASTNARNVAQLLVQALHSKDTALLRTTFTNKDEQVVRSTLQRLPPEYVGPLVNELILETQKKTTHVQTAVVWLRVLLQTHASQLMAIGTTELFTRFGPLLGLIEHRANTMHTLSKLGGRLDLLVSQIKTNTEEDTLASENLLVYEDRDSSDDEGFANPGGESSDDWEEEESEVENGDENMVVSDGNE